MIANPETLHPLVRRLTPDDLDRVFEIELSAYPFPWTRGIFADCIRVGYECWGLQAGKDLIGYCIQTHAAGENHLLNLCIASQWQRQGLGNILLDHAVRLARLHGCERMFLEVRPSNEPAIHIYEKAGFQPVGRRKNYYMDTREDAVVMSLAIGPGEGG